MRNSDAQPLEKKRKPPFLHQFKKHKHSSSVFASPAPGVCAEKPPMSLHRVSDPIDPETGQELIRTGSAVSTRVTVHPGVQNNIFIKPSIV